ncbi:MAG: hypothetical protein U9P14_00735, partial [Gemmatimonadota bacterium]|nr:hypothetical protein [Gemmatimonadota bacterium]
LAADSRTGTIILVSRSSGDIRLYRPRSLDPAAGRMSLGGTLVAFHAPEGADRLYLASGSGTSSSVFSLSLVGRGGGGEDEARLERIVSLSAPVRRITSAEKGKVLYLLAGSSWLFRIEADKPHDRRQIDLKTHCQRVLAADGKLFVTGGLEDLFVLPEDFYQAKPERLALEMGPGPMLALGNERILVANSLSNSVTIVNTRELEEDISVLVGVLLGRMFYQDRRLVVNNLFRGNVMVYDPDNLLIEDIIPVGGSLEFSPAGGRYVVFDDSLMTSFDSPPSSVTARYDLDLPYGLRFFAPTKNTGSFLVVDQNQSMFLADLGSRFRHSGLLLPDVCMALFTGKKKAWAFFPSELALFSLGEKELAWLRGFTVRPYKMTRTYLASDGFHRFRGSELFWIAGDRLVELTSTRETVGAMREDPDTNYTYIITGRTLHVFEEGQVAPRSVVRLSGPVEDVYLPAGSEHAYLAGPGQVAIVHRESLYRWDKIEPGGSFVYVHGDELFLRDGRNRRRLVVADGYRGSVYQQIDLPLVPTDAAADHERLFLLGGAQGAVAVYVNRVDTRRLPRNRDRHAWDTDADRRAGTHR